MSPLRTFLIVVALLIGGGFLAYLYVQSTHDRQIANLTLTDIPLSTVADGTYTGSHKVFPIEVEVSVTVKDHKITAIRLVRHQTGQGGPAEAVIPRVLSSQSLKVDVVTGATGSSKVILKAVENALSAGRK